MASPKVRYVILDTNMILSIFEKHVDLMDEINRIVGKCTITIPSVVIEELKKLSRSGIGKTKINAKSALRYIKESEYMEIKTGKDRADDKIVELASKLNAVVATNDRELIRKLKKIHIPILILREEKLLELRGSII